MTAPADQEKTLELFAQGGWDAVHRGGIFDGGKGTPPEEVLRELGLERLAFESYVVVMEIGIGAGLLTRRLVTYGHYVLAVDASPAALANVNNVARTSSPDKLFLFEEPFLDLALSFLVFQHIPTPDLERLLAQVFRLLKPGGTLHAQYAYLTGEPLPEWFRRDMDAGFVFPRDPETMREMISAAGGVLQKERITKPCPGVGWGILTAEKRT